MEMITLGHGMLTWGKSERVSDRYGYVCFTHCDSENNGNHPFEMHVDVLNNLEGKIGKIIAKVVETRESTHIGDFFRGIFPETPNVGDAFVLGEGELSVDTSTKD